MNWSPAQAPQPGDMIRVRLGPVLHYGVFASNDEVYAFGYPPIGRYAAENDPATVVSTTMEVFCAGQIPEVGIPCRKEKKKMFKPKKRLEIASSRLGGGGYNILHNNCEHFAYECCFGVKYSEQEEAAREKWKSRTVLDVYIAPVPEKPEEISFPTKARENYIAETKNERLRAERTAVWKLFGRGLARSMQFDETGLDFERLPSGRWREVRDSVFFSFSHTEGYAVCALSGEPVGVDAENRTSFRARHGGDPAPLGAAICAKGETLPEGEAALLALWTKKESIFKWQDKAAFLPKKIAAAKFPVQTCVFDALPDLIVSVCAQNRQHLRFFYDGGEGFTLLSPKKPEK